jgi:hypothetical protein
MEELEKKLVTVKDKDFLKNNANFFITIAKHKSHLFIAVFTNDPMLKST